MNAGFAAFTAVAAVAFVASAAAAVDEGANPYGPAKPVIILKTHTTISKKISKQLLNLSVHVALAFSSTRGLSSESTFLA